MDPKHWALIVIGGCIALSKYVASAMPQYAPYAAMVETVLTAVMGFLGVTSPKMQFGKPPSDVGGSGTGGAGTGGGTRLTPTVIMDKPRQPPSAQRRVFSYQSLVYGGRAVVVCSLCAAMALPTAGCAAAQQWWQQLIDNPAATVASLINAARNLITTADTVWALVSPLLGAQQQSATQVYEDAKITLVNALAALQSAVDASAQAKQANPNWDQLTADVESAVANLIAIVKQYAGNSTVLGAASSGDHGAIAHAMTALDARGKDVASWRKP